MIAVAEPRVVKLFVSSPLDVAPERGRVRAAANKLSREFESLVRFETVVWEERFYKADESFQPQIPEAAACDVLVSIFWTRVGIALPTDFARMPDGRPYPSGTAFELLTALQASRSKGVPDVYVFRKTADAVFPTADADRRRQAQIQLDALEAFWGEWFKSEQGHFKAAFQTFASTDEFERQIELLLRQWLESRGLLGPRLKWPKEKGSPFRGLAPFEAEHAAVFFGRDRVIDEARRRLSAAAEKGSAFLLIVGASGAGKSSLARAGLIPRLTTPGMIAAVDLWRVAIMKPSDGQAGAITSLAVALLAALPELAQGDFPTSEALADNLRRGGAAAARPIVGALSRIGEAAQLQKRTDRPLRPLLLLLVDQLEELFAQAVGDDERKSFASALREFAATGRVWCVATLRVDLYALLLKEPGLKALKEAGASLDLGPPGAAELAEIVRAPTAAAGLLFEANAESGALDERLLADASSAESLPLLQFTLRQLYDRRQERDHKTLLTHAAYDALGGLHGAIAAEADRAIAALPPRAVDTLPRLLRQLAKPARDGQTLTLREVVQDDICAGPAEAALVDALLGARILVAGSNVAGRSTLRLAHDAVLTSWPLAAAAAQASRDFYRTRAEVEDAQRRWQERGKLADRLIQPGVPLAEAEKLVADFGRELPAELTAFVSASRNRARARQRLVAISAAFFFALAVLAAVAAWMAVQGQQRATRTLALVIDQSDALVAKIGQELENLSGISKDAIRALLEAIEGELDRIKGIDAQDPHLMLSRAAILSVIADNYVELGDLGIATDRAKDCIAITTPLANKAPDDIDALRGLAQCLQSLGYAEIAANNLDSAQRDYAASIVLRRKVTRSDDPVALDGLSRVLNLYASSLLSAGKFDIARDTAQESRAIATRLVAVDANNFNYRRESIDSWNILSIAVYRLGDRQAALANFTDLLTSARDLAAANKGNATWQRYLSNIIGNAGYVLFDLGRREDGMAATNEALDLKRNLVRIDPSNMTWLAELTALLYTAGDMLASLQLFTHALAVFHEAVNDARTLLDHDRENVTWQIDLIACLAGRAVMQLKTNDAVGARASATEARAAIAKLDLSKVNQAQRAMIGSIQAQLPK
jgi:eukaryotic-like serine/threonine-protein kinase